MIHEFSSGSCNEATKAPTFTRRKKLADPGILCRESLGTVPKLSYKLLIKQGVWAHSRAPLQALIKIEWGFEQSLKPTG